VFDSVFEFLFKYPLADFQQGTIEIAVSRAVYGAIILLILFVAWLLYRRVGGKTGTADRIVLPILRTLLLAVAVFSLLQPVLTLSSVVPQRSVVGVLIDDSRSMRIDDLDDQARAAFVADQFGASQNGLLAGLADRFDVRLFRFATHAEAIDSVDALDFAGTRTDLGRALQDARHALAGLPLAGLVVVSDGADNAAATLNEPLLALRAASTPVYSVGVGREAFAKDIEISRVQLPSNALKGTAVVADLTLRQYGYAGQTLPVIVETDGRILQTQDVPMAADGEPMSLQLQFTLEEPGPRRLSFRIPLQDGERITQNNGQEALTLVADRREKILYLEGEPRFELKFIRRAVNDDDNLQIVSLLRTAENKFYRLGIDDPQELVDGFPRTREELFRYRGLILGNIEAAFFSREQLQLIVDYVSDRGGGLLLLGGSKAFAEGGYGDSPLADIIPVELEARADGSFAREVSIRPTRLGASHPVTRLNSDDQLSSARWASLPALTAVNPIYRAKPGAALLLDGVDDAAARSSPSVVLAAQRYGRGRVIAFAVQNSWLWQMHHAIEPDDQTHETLWRQLLRWLVSSVPQRLEVTLPTQRVAPNEAVALAADFRNEAYATLNNAEVRALITSPTGVEQELTLPWSVRDNPLYHASFAPQEQGLYELHLRAFENDAVVAESEAYINVSEQAHEYHRAEMQAGLLRRVADETGGRFFTTADAAALVDAIEPVQSGTTEREQRELWDMPILWLLIVLLITLEWGYRRWRGLI
jgi:uncharacterized membrane protein